MLVPYRPTYLLDREEDAELRLEPLEPLRLLDLEYDALRLEDRDELS